MNNESPDQLYRKLQRDISSKGYSEVAFPMSQDELREAEKKYLQFLTLPSAEKEKFEIWIPGLHRDEPSKGTRFGYKDKSRKRGEGDDKVYFHHGDYLRGNLAELIRDSPLEARDFIEAADCVLSGIKKAMRPVYKAIDKKVPGFEDSFVGTPYIFLRFLAYKPVDKGEGLAIGHFDRGSLTLAMYENRPGLHICPATDKDFEGETEEETKAKLEEVLRRLKPVTHSPDTAFLFTSDGITSVLPPEYLHQFPKGYHGVKEQHQDGQPYERRTAIVAFISPNSGVSIGGWDSRHKHGIGHKF